MPSSPSEPVPRHDPHEREEQYTICEKCGADLLWHCCDEPEAPQDYELTSPS